MKFTIKRKPATDIEVIDFVIEENNNWKYWKSLMISFFLGALIGVFSVIWLYEHDLPKLGIKLQMNRSMTLNLGKKYEQERDSSGANGTTTTSN